MIGKGIKLSTGFDLNSQSPLDNREVFETIEERDALPSINLYEGLTCYVKETKENYQYIDGNWTIKNSGIERISYGDTEPSDGDILLWIDTSADKGVSSLLTDDILLEFRAMIIDLNSQIDTLKANNIALERRVAYLEQNASSGGSGGSGGGGGGGDVTTEVQLTFEDGNIMTFEDESIMTFEN